MTSLQKSFSYVTDGISQTNSAGNPKSMHTQYARQINEQGKLNYTQSSVLNKGSHGQPRPPHFYGNQYSLPPSHSSTMHQNDLPRHQSQLAIPLDRDQSQDYSRMSKYTGKSSNLIHQQSGYSQLNEQIQLDMAYLYADPIVFERDSGGLAPVNVPLDLETEYEMLLMELKKSKKQFKIKRECINHVSLTRMMAENPKIIHISSHGAKDPKTGKYYLAAECEGDKMGIEDKLDQERLTDLLESNCDEEGKPIHQVKLAFVSACHSEKIGELFLNAGVPLVIAVNSTQAILDRVCKNFTRSFYDSLLMGQTFNIAYKNATKVVKGGTDDVSCCCCAHKHDADCWWYLYFQDSPKEAHELHSKKCECKERKNGMVLHSDLCPVWQDWVKVKNEQLKKQNQPLQKALPLSNAKNKSKLAQLNLEDSDDEGFGLEQQIALNDQLEHTGPNVMCCCKADEHHNETMKFQVKYEEKNKHLLSKPIFPPKKNGKVIDDSEDLGRRIKMPTLIDPKQVFGRNKEVFNIVEFLASDEKMKEKKVLNLSGVTSVDECGALWIARQAVVYVVNRQRFEDGVFLVDCANKQSITGIHDAISKGLNIQNNHDDLIKFLEKKNIILFMVNLELVSSLDLKKALSSLCEQTQLKIILIMEHRWTFDQHDIDHFVQDQYIDNLDQMKGDAAKLMYQICSRVPEYKHWKLDDLRYHELFKTFHFTPLQVIRASEIVRDPDNDTTNVKKCMDKVLQVWQEDANSKDKADQQTKRHERIKDLINDIFYRQVKREFKKEINIIHILAFSQAGMSDYDLERITAYAQPQSNIHFGDWHKFLGKVILNPEHEEEDFSEEQDGSKESSKQPFHKSFSNSLKLSKADTIGQLEEIKEKVEESDGEGDGKNSGKSRPWTPKMAQWKANYHVVKKSTDSDEYMKYSLETSFLQFLQEKNLNQQEQMQFDKLQIEYLKYMSVLSRQLMQSIKFQQRREFDPYILSSQIDDSIWKEPEPNKHEYLFTGEQNYLSKNHPIENPQALFHIHEENFQNILSNKNLQLYAENKSPFERLTNESTSPCRDFFEEIAINFASILIMIGKYKDAHTVLQRLELQGMSYLKVRFTLINISLNLFHNLDEQGFDKEANLQETISFVREQQENRHKELCLAEIYFAYALTLSKKFSQETKKKELTNSPKMLDRHSSGFHKLNETRKMGSFQAGLIDQFETIFKHLENSREHFKDEQISVSKTWLVQAEIFLQNPEFAECLHQSMKHGIQSVYETLFEELESSWQIFYQMNYIVLGARCLVQQAKILINQRDFGLARDKIFICLQISRSANDDSLEMQANALFNQVSAYLKKQNSNQFIFAKAFPLDLINKENESVSVYLDQIQDDRISLLNGLEACRMQIDLSFEVLTRSFIIDSIKKACPKILHLSPPMLKVEDNDTLVVETEKFSFLSLNLDIKSLEEIGQLDIYLVIIEMTDCQKICEAFKRLGVSHVISFSAQKQEKKAKVIQPRKEDKKPSLVPSSSDEASDQSPPDDIDETNDEKIRRYQSAMKDFCLKLYPLLVEDGHQITDAIQKAQNKMIKTSNFKVIHLMRDNVSKTDVLYGSKEVDEAKQLKQGQVIDVSAVQKGDFNYSTRTGHYYIFNNNSFLQIVEQLYKIHERYEQLGKHNDIGSESQIAEAPKSEISAEFGGPYFIVNVFGKRGVGKTKTVISAVQYLRYRFMFQAGIHYFDLSKVKNFEEINRVVMIQQTQEKETSLKSPKFKKNASYASKIGSVRNDFSNDSLSTTKSQLSMQRQRIKLLVLDNCDKFLAKDKLSFTGNIDCLNKLSNNLGIVLISESKIQDHQIPSEPILIEPFREPQISMLFLRCWHPEQVPESNVLNTLLKRAKGNVQIISILYCIFKYGNTSLLDKVKIMRYSELEQVHISSDDAHDADLFDTITQKKDYNFNDSFQSKNRLNFALQSSRWRNQKLSEYQLRSTFQGKKPTIIEPNNNTQAPKKKTAHFETGLLEYENNMRVEQDVSDFGSQESETESAHERENKDNRQNFNNTIKQSEKFKIEPSSGAGGELVFNQTIGPSMLNTMRPSQKKKTKISDMNQTVMPKKKKQVLVTVAEEDENASSIPKKQGDSQGTYQLSHSISIPKPAQSINKFRGFHIKVIGENNEPFVIVIDTDQRHINILCQKKQDQKKTPSKMGQTHFVKKQNYIRLNKENKSIYLSQRIKKLTNMAECRYESLTKNQRDNIKQIVIYLPPNFDGPNTSEEKEKNKYMQLESKPSGGIGSSLNRVEPALPHFDRQCELGQTFGTGSGENYDMTKIKLPISGEIVEQSSQVVQPSKKNFINTDKKLGQMQRFQSEKQKLQSSKEILNKSQFNQEGLEQKQAKEEMRKSEPVIVPKQSMTVDEISEYPFEYSSEGEKSPPQTFGKGNEKQYLQENTQSNEEFEPMMQLIKSKNINILQSCETKTEDQQFMNQKKVEKNNENDPKENNPKDEEEKKSQTEVVAKKSEDQPGPCSLMPDDYKNPKDAVQQPAGKQPSSTAKVQEKILTAQEGSEEDYDSDDCEQLDLWQGDN